MERIPERARDLFERESFGHVSVVDPDGLPHVTPVWIDYDGEHVLFNTARGRRKERYVRENPNVGVSVLDPDDPYRYVSVRGQVVDVTEEGAVEHIDDLARRYMDVDEYPHHGEEIGPRVIVWIRPDEVITNG